MKRVYGWVGATTAGGKPTPLVRHCDVGVVKDVLATTALHTVISFDRYTFANAGDDDPMYFGNTEPLGCRRTDDPFQDKSTKTIALNVARGATVLAVSPATPCFVDGTGSQVPIRWVPTTLPALIGQHVPVDLTYDRATGAVAQVRADAGC